MKSIVNGKTLTSIAHRFAAFRRFRPRLTSLKRAAYCRRHVGVTLGSKCAYCELLRSYRTFLLCTYKTNIDAQQHVHSFVAALDVLVEDVERVHCGQIPAVRGRVIANVGTTSTALRKALKGTSKFSDCKDDWLQFGYAYHSIFSA